MDKKTIKHIKEIADILKWGQKIIKLKCLQYGHEFKDCSEIGIDHDGGICMNCGIKIPQEEMKEWLRK